VNRAGNETPNFMHVKNEAPPCRSLLMMRARLYAGLTNQKSGGGG
jgi:hypothetical protein